MKIEETEFCGLASCLLLANDQGELVITFDVGPRIISYQHLPGGKVAVLPAVMFGRSEPPAHRRAAILAFID